MAATADGDTIAASPVSATAEPVKLHLGFACFDLKGVVPSEEDGTHPVLTDIIGSSWDVGFLLNVDAAALAALLPHLSAIGSFQMVTIHKGGPVTVLSVSQESPLLPFSAGLLRAVPFPLGPTIFTTTLQVFRTKQNVTLLIPSMNADEANAAASKGISDTLHKGLTQRIGNKAAVLCIGPSAQIAPVVKALGDAVASTTSEENLQFASWGIDVVPSTLTKRKDGRLLSFMAHMATYTPNAEDKKELSPVKEVDESSAAAAAVDADA